MRQVRVLIGILCAICLPAMAQDGTNLRVLFPAGKDICLIGQNIAIQTSVKRGLTVLAELSRDGGLNFNEILGEYPIREILVDNQYKIPWQVTGPATLRAVIRVTVRKRLGSFTGNSGEFAIIDGGTGSGGDGLLHASLSGLANDDHPQYLPLDGRRPMTGNLKLAQDPQSAEDAARKAYVDGKVANAGGVPSVQAGLEGNLPSPGTAGRLFLATDALKIFRDDGASWVLMSQAPRAEMVSLSAGAYNATPVSNHCAIKCDTSGGDITLNGLANGVAGDLIEIFNSGSGTVTVNHESGLGGQKFRCAGEESLVLYKYGGATLLCDGTYWFVLAQANVYSE